MEPGSVIFKCPNCTFSTKYRANLRRHMVAKHKVTRFKCDCGFLATNAIHLQIHKSQCGNIPPPIPVPQNNMLHSNLKKSIKLRAHSCNDCSYQTISAKEFLQHRISHHQHQITIFECEYCSYASEYASNVKRHKAVAHNKSSLDSNENHPSSNILNGAHSNSGLKPKVIYKCKFCPFRALNEGNLISHNNKEHTLKKVFKCPECDFVTRVKLMYEKHIMKHKRLHFRCELCPFTSPYQYNINRHIRRTHPEYAPQIGLNGNISSDSSNQEPSVNILSKRKLLKKLTCIYCPFTTGDESEFKDHMESHAEATTYSCSVCDFQSEDHLEIQKHIDTVKYTNPVHINAQITIVANDQETSQNDSVLNDKMFICAHCDFRNLERRSVISHLGVHANMTPFFCSACNYESNWQHSIIQHIKTKHGSSVDDHLYQRISYEVKKHVISLTAVYPEGRQTRYHNQASLLAVANQQQQVNPETENEYNDVYSCNICPYKTDRSFYLKRHEAHHKPRSDYKYKCSSCPFYTNLNTSMAQHKKWHTGEAEKNETKTYQCENCPFTSLDSLKFLYHKQFHRANKSANFFCKYCTYWAPDVENLTRHVKLHAGAELPPKQTPVPKISTASKDSKLKYLKNLKHLCKSCPACFKSRSNLDTHLKFHGQNLEFTCNNCDYSAKCLLYLRRHTLVHAPFYLEKRKFVENNLKNNQSNSNVGNYASKTFITYEGSKLTEQPLELRLQMESRAFDQMLLLEEIETKSVINGEFPKPNEKFLKCRKCPGVFRNGSVFAHHISLHSSAGKYGCFQCSYATDSKENLEVHLQLHSANIKNTLSKAFFSCSECPALFMKKIDFEIHLECHGTNIKAEEEKEVTKPLISPIIASLHDSTNFKNEIGMGLDKLFGCSFCPFTSDSEGFLDRHLQSHDLPSGADCPHCTFKGQNKSDIKQHLVCHYDIPSWGAPQAYIRYQNLVISSRESGKMIEVFNSLKKCEPKDESD